MISIIIHFGAKKTKTSDRPNKNSKHVVGPILEKKITQKVSYDIWRTVPTKLNSFVNFCHVNVGDVNCRALRVRNCMQSAADRLTDPVNELSDHAVPAAVESSVPEAGVVNRPEVVVELDDV